MSSRGAVQHSHLFPGSRVQLVPAPEGSTAESLGLGEVVLEFNDGSVAAAELVTDDDGQVLLVEAYETAVGTPIPAKAWIVAGHEMRGADVRLRLGRNLQPRS